MTMTRFSHKQGKCIFLLSIVFIPSSVTSSLEYNGNAIESTTENEQANVKTTLDVTTNSKFETSILTSASVVQWNLTRYPKSNSPDCIHHVFNQNNSGIICDPDFILRKEEQDQIAEGIDLLSNIFTRRSNSASSPRMNKHERRDKNKLNKEKQVRLSVSVALMNKMEIQSNRSEESIGKDFTVGLHEEWHISSRSCPASSSSPPSSISSSSSNETRRSILFFLSLYDHTIHISLDVALQKIFTHSRIDQIIDEMKPFLRKDLCGKCILIGLQNLMHTLEKNKDAGSTSTSAALASAKKSAIAYYDYLFLAFIIIIFSISNTWQKKWDARDARERSELNARSRDRALALQRRYRCTMCPICLEDFPPNKMIKNWNIQNDLDNENCQQKQQNKQTILSQDHFEDKTPSQMEIQGYLAPSSFDDIAGTGSDGLPLKLLRCGHVFDETCWLTFLNTGHGDVTLCPVCKQDVGKDVTDVSSSLSLISIDTNDQDIQQPLLNNDNTAQINNYYEGNTEYDALLGYLSLFFYKLTTSLIRQ